LLLLRDCLKHVDVPKEAILFNDNICVAIVNILESLNIYASATNNACVNSVASTIASIRQCGSRVIFMVGRKGLLL